MAKTKKKEAPQFEEVDGASTHPKRRQGGRYTALLTRLGKLKPGKAILLTVPKDVEPAVYRNRISAAVRNAAQNPDHDLDTPKGCRFRVELQIGEAKLAVRLIKD